LVAACVILLSITMTHGTAIAGSASVVHATQKIRRGDAAVSPGVTSIQLEAARGEFEAFQIVVRGPATTITARPTDMIGPGGAKLLGARCDDQGTGQAGNIRLHH